ncbi:MAG: CaiB/BaiF CoA transferase family protein [Burkholderiaceae bacterium]
MAEAAPPVPRPLAGIRVLDLTHVLSGPLCTYELALMGASVIKIESPGQGDMYRALGSDPALNAIGMGTSYLGPGAEKRSVALDLKSDEGRAVVRALLRQSDILVQNFKPGVAERLGLGYEQCAALKPSLVYCAISGFGQSGPMRDVPAVDHSVQGIAGMMAVTGPADGPPMRVGYAAADTATGLLAGMAVLGALVGALRTGKGCHVDVSMLEACLVAQATIYYDYLNTGHVSPRVGSDTLAMRGSGGTFETADGHLVVSALSPQAFRKLCACVDREDLIDDPRFARDAGGAEHAAALRVILAGIFRRRSTQEWIRILTEAGIPNGSLNDIPAVANLPQLHSRGAFHEFPNVPGLGRRISGLNAGFQIDGQQLRPTRPAPVLGQDTREVLRSLGYGDAEIEAMELRGVAKCATPFPQPDGLPS